MRIDFSTCSPLIVLLLCALTGSGVKAADTTLIEVITLPYNIKTIASDSAGTIWLSGARGLQYYDFEKGTFVTTDPSVKGEILADQGRVIEYIQSKKMLFFPWDRFASWLSQLPPGYARVSVARDKFGHYWISTGSQLFIFSVGDRFKRILSEYSTRGIYQDGEDLYVNTYSGILRNGQPMVELPNLGLGEIKKFGASLYIAWGGLLRYQPLTQTCDYFKFDQSQVLPNNIYWKPINPITVQNLHQIQDTIWVGTNFGLGYIENDSVVMITNHPNIQDLIYFQGGLLIAGSNLLKPRKLPIPRHNLSKPDCEDCRGMYIRQHNQLRKLDMPEFNYWQILESAGLYYLASDNGLVVWDGARVVSMITEREGLTDNRTCTMALDDHGFLWVSTFSGLNRINLSTGKITRYLDNVEFNYRSVMQNDSLIYMGSVQGIYLFNPKNFLGDDIEPAPRWSISQILLFFGIGMLILFSIFFYLSTRYNQRKLQLKEALIQETERKLFLLQIDQIAFSADSPITVSNLSDALDISERTLYRNFQDYGITPGAYLKELRVKKAKHLLNGSNDQFTVKEIASKVGYTEQYLRKLLNEEGL